MVNIRGRAIVIDDDLKLKRQIVDILNRNRYEVQCYGCGRRFLSDLNERELDFDFAITDMNVHDVSGEQILRELKLKYPNRPTIGISESGQYSNNYRHHDGTNHNMRKEMDCFVSKREERGEKTFNARDLLTCMMNLGFETNLTR